MAIQKVGVVGCGLMGSGIAQVSAQAGFATVVREISPNALEKGMGSIQKFLKGGVEKGKLTQEAADKTLANLKGTVELKDLADCDLVIEAATENVQLKKEIFGALEGICKPAAHPGLQHLESLDHRAGHVHQASGAVRRASLLQSRAAHEAGRGGAHGAVEGRGGRPRSRSGARRSARPWCSAAIRPVSS